MKIKILGCSNCKRPYNYTSIKYDNTISYAEIPLCEGDGKSCIAYTDILIEIDV